MKMTSAITSDLATLRSQLQDRGNGHSDLLRLSPWVVLRDILWDCLLVAGALMLVVAGGALWSPLSLLVIGNRQRALGNVLHDAGHGNLIRNRARNDSLTQLLVAPLLFADLSRYRSTHYQHHARLGDATADPDFLVRQLNVPSHWSAVYAHFVFSWKGWLGSMGGHLSDPEVSAAAKAYILLWWFALTTLIALTAGTLVTSTFLLLWLAARATVFHLITTFREMCDHHGLQPGGVFSFSRDVCCSGLWRLFIHPRNNGYHLTHHLLPAVPYYRLPEAQALLQATPLYLDRSTVCTAYFSGADAVTRAWAAQGDA